MITSKSVTVTVTDRLTVEIHCEVIRVAKQLIDGGYGGVIPASAHTTITYTYYVDGREIGSASGDTTGSPTSADHLGLTAYDQDLRAQLAKTGRTHYVMVRDDESRLTSIGMTAEAAAVITAAADSLRAELAPDIVAAEAQKRAEDERAEFARCEQTVREAEAQRWIPTNAEYKAWRRNYNNVNNEGGEGFIPSMVTREQYERAKSVLASHQ